MHTRQHGYLIRLNCIQNWAEVIKKVSLKIIVTLDYSWETWN